MKIENSENYNGSSIDKIPIYDSFFGKAQTCLHAMEFEIVTEQKTEQDRM